MASLTKSIRVITVAPIMALAAMLILWCRLPEIFGGTENLLFAILFLTVLPISAYPLQPFIPKFKDMGRKGQRSLAIVMAVIGYIFGIVYGLAKRVPDGLLLIFMSYLFSGLLILLFNKGLHIRASGHACGVMGPIAYLYYFIGAAALFGVIIWLAVLWSSLNLRRHKLSDLILGSVLPVLAVVISEVLLGLF